jgi:hypothetical protein
VTVPAASFDTDRDTTPDTATDPASTIVFNAWVATVPAAVTVLANDTAADFNRLPAGVTDPESVVCVSLVSVPAGVTVPSSVVSVCFTIAPDGVTDPATDS